MKKFIVSCCVSLVALTLIVAMGYAQCNNLTGDYSYLNGRGYARVIQSGNAVTIFCRWTDGDEYLFRTHRNGKQLSGDWTLIRDNGRNMPSPIFRNYEAQVNIDCSIVGTRSEDPERRNINGVVLTPAR